MFDEKTEKYGREGGKRNDPNMTIFVLWWVANVLKGATFCYIITKRHFVGFSFA